MFNIYISAYEFDKALDLLSECYIKDSQNTDYLLKIAYCHSQSGIYPDAKLFYEETIKIDSLNLIAINRRIGKGGRAFGNIPLGD